MAEPSELDLTAAEEDEDLFVSPLDLRPCSAGSGSCNAGCCNDNC